MSQYTNLRYSITLNDAQLDYLSDEQQDILLKAVLCGECAKLVIGKYLSELQVNNNRDGISQSEAGKHKSCTAADSQNCHDNTVLVTGNVSCSDL